MSPLAGSREAPAAITLDHDTIVGDDTFSSSGLYAGGGSANGRIASVTMRNSILRGFTASLLRFVAAGSGGSTVTTSYSDYAPTTKTIGSGPGGFTQGAGNVDADPAFASAAGGDYRLTASSPAIDAGDPAGLLGNEPGVDLAGLPRIVLGNAGCAVRSDMGAFEFQATGLCTSPPPPAPPAPAATPPADVTAPVLSRLTASPSRFRPAPAGKAVRKRGTTLRFSLTEAANVKLAIVRIVAGRKSGGRCRAHGSGPRCTTSKQLGTLAVSGKAGANALAFTGRVRGHALPAGAYQVVATAGDAAGNVTAHAIRAGFKVVR
ncbi:choice-of-anchor Q domain-containing protein [Candidatus Solirubrobacter pratensis]|uniref:choice-of-anchor Q domain-containing protein n=1 Tax=Candidatus Solirubrobacter pratensis TaxID=1298857 RepID=UPI0003F9E78A|nr:choice-of-anchor Q domain-containing protein [Candidatus Solirubrobacter pratensis]